VLYARDGPACSPRIEVEKVRPAGLDTAAERLVLGENAPGSWTASGDRRLAGLPRGRSARGARRRRDRARGRLPGPGPGRRLRPRQRSGGGGRGELPGPPDRLRPGRPARPGRRGGGAPRPRPRAAGALPPPLGGHLPDHRPRGRGARRRGAGDRRGRVSLGLGGPPGRGVRPPPPHATVVATSGGQINISGLGQTDAELALAAAANLCLQTTGVYREDFLDAVVARFGPGRLLFASAFPASIPASSSCGSPGRGRSATSPGRRFSAATRGASSPSTACERGRRVAGSPGPE
jgi:hypothetical protein